MRKIALMFLIFFPSPVLAKDPVAPFEGITSIVETLGSIIIAAKVLDDILLFLILIAVIGILAIVLHLWHRRNSVTLTLLALLFLAVAVAANFTYKARKDLQKVDESQLFLPLGVTRSLGPFTIKLTCVDTLKAKIKEGEMPPWVFNQKKFGHDALKEFVALGQTRLKADFLFSADTKVMERWSKVNELIEFPDNDESSFEWQALMKQLEVTIVNKVTEREVKLKKAFSKWPLAHLTICIDNEDEFRIDRFFPDRRVISLRDLDGKPYALKIETIFNGDRDLGEAEACVLSLQPISLEEVPKE